MDYCKFKKKYLIAFINNFSCYFTVTNIFCFKLKALIFLFEIKLFFLKDS